MPRRHKDTKNHKELKISNICLDKSLCLRALVARIYFSEWTQSYISKLERNLKDIRFSTLQRIINEGSGGHIDTSIRL